MIGFLISCIFWLPLASHLKKNFLEDISNFCEKTETPVLVLVMSTMGFKPRMHPHLHASSPACNEFLRFTSDVTHADHSTAKMAAKAYQTRMHSSRMRTARSLTISH